MSAQPSPTESTFPVESMHHAQQEQAIVQVTSTEQLPQGVSLMSGKALLAKKMAASGNSFYSPTDNMVSPCTAKLHNTKKKHFTKGKPLSLSNKFQQERLTGASNGFLSPQHAMKAQAILGLENTEVAEDGAQ